MDRSAAASGGFKPIVILSESVLKMGVRTRIPLAVFSERIQPDCSEAFPTPECAGVCRQLVAAVGFATELRHDSRWLLLGLVCLETT